MIKMVYETKPWLKFYSEGVPETIDYPNVTMYEKLIETCGKYPSSIAMDFMGSELTYEQFGKEVDKFADALAAKGFKEGNIITISMPTAPNGVIPIYAVNKLGGICSMIHPLSPPAQIKMYCNLSKSTWALTLDAFYPAFKEIIAETSVKNLILARIPDYLGGLLKFGFNLTKGRKITTKKKTLVDPMVLWYDDLMAGDYTKANKGNKSTDELAIILYSGGTTGVPKGIMLSNKNLIAEGMQVAYWAGMDTTDSILAILPIFHGFGLGVCVNAAFMNGGKSILIPTFTPESVAKLINKKKPSFLIGVPTLFEALASNPVFKKADLSCLKATFSGADTLPRKVKEKFEQAVKEGGGNTKLLEGYGLTEAVTAMMAMPMDQYREASIGIPFPDMLAKICKLGTTEEAALGEEGEICVAGPDVMLGYMDRPDATAETLKKHSDGQIWLHTGDIGTMDEDGFFYFKLRQKRMLKVSGINVYPKHVEETLRKHPDIKDVCVIGVPDRKQITKVKAYVIPKDPSKANDDLKQAIKKYGMSELLKYESPREIEFADELPTTLVGKIAWKKLEDQELEKLKAAGEYPFDE
jgi:long-chain acyl-CoA synthetase